MTLPDTFAPTLLLDVMGTMVFDPFLTCVPAFFGMTLEQLLREKHPTAWVDFELGAIDEETFLPRFFRDGRRYDHDGFKQMMRSRYAWLPGMEPLVSELHASGIEMHTLSNYTSWYRMIEERTQLSRFVRWTFVSCDMHVRKPDPNAYLHASAALGKPVEACLFVDDRPRNCEAARELGMPAIVFRDAAQLRQDLVVRGLLGA